MISVGIVGATGYTGVELIRFLVQHPQVNLTVVTSDSEKGKTVAEVFPALRKYVDLKFVPHATDELKQCQVVFFATPHATAMYQVQGLLDAGCRVIDLSADFRLTDSKLWQQWYGVEHGCPELLDSAVYGLPELNRESIRQARLVANPGCYPTAVLLALLPALNNQLVDVGNIIADAKSGVSGAGRKAALAGLHAEVSESFKAYGVAGHRHLPEILQFARQGAGDDAVDIVFVPHLVPMNRGILATVYMQSKDADTNWQQVYESFYEKEMFVDVLPAGSHPETRYVRGTNNCHIAIHPAIQGTNNVVVLSAIDNLVKGAAGQAIHNMNLMFAFEENESLLGTGLIP